MYTIEYDIDHSALLDFINALAERFQAHATNLAKSVQSAEEFAVAEWTRVASRKFLHTSGNYVRGISEGAEYPFNNDPLFAKITNRVKYAMALEKGYGAFDMRKMLYTSDKVRISKDGKRYIIIPFEHGTPGSKTKREMPKEIYSQAKDLRASVVATTFREGSVRTAKTIKEAEILRKFNPVKVMRRNYNWGERLDSPDSIYDGMVRFEKNPNKIRQTGKFAGINKTENTQRYGNYLTFRVISEDSTGWQHPGISSMNILKETKDNIQQPVLNMLAEGAKKDIKLILNEYPSL